MVHLYLNLHCDYLFRNKVELKTDSRLCWDLNCFIVLSDAEEKPEKQL